MNSPPEQVADLIARINALSGVRHGIRNSLVSKLEASLAAIAAGRAAPACGTLGALLNQARAQAGKGLTAAQAGDLIVDVRRIRAALGCG